MAQNPLTPACPLSTPASRGVFRARARGFSLIEITLVLAIIGVLMAVAAVNIAGAAKRANKRATEASLNTIGTAITDYHLNNSITYPSELSDLVEGDFLEPQSLNDAWGQPFYYNPSPTSAGDPFQLLSGGPDKQVGTEDDLNYWVLKRGQ